MNTTPTDEAILKTDLLGRVRTPREHREMVLDEFERSGLSGERFATLAGIKYSTFATWAQKRRRQRDAYRVPHNGGESASRIASKSHQSGVKWS